MQFFSTWPPPKEKLFFSDDPPPNLPPNQKQIILLTLTKRLCALFMSKMNVIVTVISLHYYNKVTVLCLGKDFSCLKKRFIDSNMFTATANP